VLLALHIFLKLSKRHLAKQLSCKISIGFILKFFPFVSSEKLSSSPKRQKKGMNGTQIMSYSRSVGSEIFVLSRPRLSPSSELYLIRMSFCIIVVRGYCRVHKTSLTGQQAVEKTIVTHITSVSFFNGNFEKKFQVLQFFLYTLVFFFAARKKN